MLSSGWGGFGANLLNRLPIDTSSVTDRLTAGFNLDALQNPDGEDDDGHGNQGGADASLAAVPPTKDARKDD